MVRVWQGEAKSLRLVLYIPFLLFSVIYGLCLAVRAFAYRVGILKSAEAKVPVISVGNITLGGTGKTPVVDRLARKLRENGYNPGIITRGYMRRRPGVFHVDPRSDTAGEVGDEAMMLAKRTEIPVIVGAKRIQAIDKGIDMFGIDMAILDDGFQLKNVRKDLDILILNAKDGVASRDLFPLGPYREPEKRISDADIIVVNKGVLDEKTKRHAGRIPVFQASYYPASLCNMRNNSFTHYNFLMGKRVLAFSGLGDNRSFFQLLNDIGADVVHTISYPDHYTYSQVDMEKCLAVQDVQCIVTTEKDAVKLLHLDLPENLFYLSINIVIEREEELLGIILDRIGRTPRRERKAENGEMTNR